MKRFVYSGITFLLVLAYCGYEYWYQTGLQKYFITLLSVKIEVDRVLFIRISSAVLSFALIWTPIYLLGVFLIRASAIDPEVDENTISWLARTRKIVTVLISCSMITVIGISGYTILISKGNTQNESALLVLAIGFLVAFCVFGVGVILQLYRVGVIRRAKLSEEAQSRKNAWIALILAPVIAGFIPYLYEDLVKLETQGGEMTVHRIVYLLYTALGKDGVVIGLGIISAAFFVYGLKKLLFPKASPA